MSETHTNRWNALRWNDLRQPERQRVPGRRALWRRGPRRILPMASSPAQWAAGNTGGAPTGSGTTGGETKPGPINPIAGPLAHRRAGIFVPGGNVTVARFFSPPIVMNALGRGDAAIQQAIAIGGGLRDKRFRPSFSRRPVAARWGASARSTLPAATCSSRSRLRRATHSSSCQRCRSIALMPPPPPRLATAGPTPSSGISRSPAHPTSR